MKNETVVVTGSSTGLRPNCSSRIWYAWCPGCVASGPRPLGAPTATEWCDDLVDHMTDTWKIARTGHGPRRSAQSFRPSWCSTSSTSASSKKRMPWRYWSRPLTPNRRSKEAVWSEIPNRGNFTSRS